MAVSAIQPQIQSVHSDRIPFGPWPWYVPATEALAVAVCFLVWMPFYVFRKGEALHAPGNG